MQKTLTVFTILSVLGLMIILLSLGYGPSGFKWPGNAINYKVITTIRLPRVLLAFLAGSTLAVAGASLQGLLLNPLVSPYTLGVASGSSLGAVIAIRTGIDIVIPGLGGIFTLSFITGGFVLVMLMRIAAKSMNGNTITVLLAGITIASFSSSAIMFIQYTSSYNESFKMVRWLMGTLDFVTMKQIYSIAPFTIIPSVILISRGKDLNLLGLGTETAITAGLNTKKLVMVIIISTGIAVASVVSIAGPIAFAGIIVPHAIRLLGIKDYRFLLPLSAIGGGIFLVASDLIARTVLAPIQLPTGVITSLTGGPFFLFLLFQMGKTKTENY
ncbi:MAG: iron ABC transporter permease [Deltaproteobacteria bacterium]|nr:iron ABC transporter permease [Deltaproteobacteria bacterium]